MSWSQTSFFNLRGELSVYHQLDLPDLTIWVRRWVSCRKQELLTIRKHPCPPLIFWWCQCCSFFLVFCVVLFYFVCPMLPVSLDCSFLILPSVFSDVYLQLFWTKYYMYIQWNLSKHNHLGINFCIWNRNRCSVYSYKMSKDFIQ